MKEFIINYLNELVLIAGILATLMLLFLYYLKLKSRPLLNYIPNIWTSLGILGTFISIVWSLEWFSRKESILQDGENSIRFLIESLAPAFWTSIIGICGAIATSILIKIIYAIEDKNEQQTFATEVGSDISPERLLNRINSTLKKLVSVTQLQETNIKSFLDSFLANLESFYDRIYEANREQVQVLSQEYVDSVATVLSETKEAFDDRLDYLLSGLIQNVDNAKTELIGEIKSTLNDSYQLLMARTDSLTNQLLDRVKELKEELFTNSIEQCSTVLTEVQEKIQQIIVMLENSLKAQTQAFEASSRSLSTDLTGLTSSVSAASGEYAELVDQLNRLLPALERQVNDLERNNSLAEKGTSSLSETVALLDEIAKKNQQLRYELTQWKRVHKRVKINNRTGNKECPNCGAENPVEANYCRECSCGFWDCEVVE